MTTMVLVASLAGDIQQFIFDAAQLLLYPVLDALLVCLLWALVELGVFIYEVVQRYQKRDLDALEASALRARKAFAAGKPRAAYRHLQENVYSIVVTRFLFDLIQNYQTERLAAKPLKLLQEYEFYTIRRLERTRILTRIGPILGLMGGLIPLAPALNALAKGDVVQLAENLQITFSVVVIGLLIGALGYIIGSIRERMYSQDISDLEYLLELLEGNDARLDAGRRRDKRGQWEAQPRVTFVEVAEDEAVEEAAVPAGGWKAKFWRKKAAAQEAAGTEAEGTAEAAAEAAVTTTEASADTAAAASAADAELAAAPAAPEEPTTAEQAAATETPAESATPAAQVAAAAPAGEQPTRRWFHPRRPGPTTETAAAPPATSPATAAPPAPEPAAPPQAHEPAVPAPPAVPAAAAAAGTTAFGATDAGDLSTSGAIAAPPASFDAPERSWFTDDDPFAALGPVDADSESGRHSRRDSQRADDPDEGREPA